MGNAFSHASLRSCSMQGVMLIGALGATPVFANNLAFTVGTDGASADWTMPVSQRLQTRLHFSYLKIDVDQTSKDIDYKVAFDNVMLGALLDWHPFSGGFRLSGGLLAGDFGIDMNAKGQDEYEVGDNTYVGDLKLDGSLDFNRVAPYVGFGWGAAVGETGLSFVADIGVLMIGTPSLSLDAQGTVAKKDQPDITLDVDADAEFQQDLEKQRVKTEKDVKDFNLYPVINLGLSYAF